MKILSHKQTLQFVSDDGKSLVVDPSPSPRDVPDWIRTCSTFEHAANVGLCFEINVVAPSTAAVEIPVAEPAGSEAEGGDDDDASSDTGLQGGSGKKKK